ncbi:T9SS type A sorting domain-containing protein [Pontibacter anaerobius]|uniref:T9SS type A sorting domain-containing protein n=1 Tax=Pontibacter anaerobius TaxID=2993940 RepID=A0ABT3RGR6_9BACT|nr:T9SS type A sorting domain-containing protein [Pontibacter anaerobius]MCX2740673.1 T9SS type A sorting domain-containing protein [Pontibacter anaerobius]
MAKMFPLTQTCVRAALTLLLLFLLSSRAFASDTQHMIPLSLQERVQQSEMVVEGEVVRQESFWDARHENIYTSSIIKVYKSFKGEVKAELIEVVTEGGTVGMKKHVFSTALKLRPGQQGLFFLKRQQMLQRTPANLPLSTRAYGSEQGFVRYNVENRTARGVFESYDNVQQLYDAVREKTGLPFRTISENQKLKASAVQNGQKQQQSAMAPVITSFSPTRASAGTGTVLTINGTGFGNSRGNGFVEFRNADDGGQTFVKPLPSEYISWTNTRITMYIPSVMQDDGTAGSGPIRVTANDGTSFTSVGSITLEFAYSNIDFNDKSFRPILTSQNNAGGYTILYSESMDSRLAAKEGFRRAVNTWVCVSEINWVLGGLTQINAASEDGSSVVRFASQSTVGESVLARTISRYEGCRSLVTNDTLFWVTEFDMEINSEINWQYGPGGPGADQFDFETVVLHELGHAHQLGHVNIPRAVMFYAIEYARLERDLSSLDIEGAELVVANSVGENACSVPPMVPNPNGECNLAPEILTLDAEFTSSNAVQVDWTTRGEQEVDQFVVQRSADGISWEDVGTVAAEGPSQTDLFYTFTDTDPLRDQSYYRLEVVYQNAESSFSPRAVVVNPADLRVLRYFPNPVGGESSQITLRYLVSRNATLQAQLYDSRGQMVRDYKVSFSTGTSEYSIDLQGLAAGIYFLKWQEGNKSGTERILKI